MNKTHTGSYAIGCTSMQRRGFTGGQFIDIVGVTGSIPVTPTIKTKAFRHFARYAGGVVWKSPEERLSNTADAPVENPWKMFPLRSNLETSATPAYSRRDLDGVR